MDCQTIPGVAKWWWHLNLPEQPSETELINSLDQLRKAKEEVMKSHKNPVLREKEKREIGELEEVKRIVGLQCLFTKLRRCLQEDRQEKFEWEIGKPEAQVLLPQPVAQQFDDYVDLREEARKKWPGVKLPRLGAEPETKLPPPRDAKSRASLLRRELSSPLKFDRGTTGFRNSWQKTLTNTTLDLAAAQIRTFQDLFVHPEPPLDALKMSKDKFKQMAGTAAERGPEYEVYMLLYLQAIFVALVRLEKKITKLSNTELINDIRWALGLECLDGKTKELFLTARTAMEEGKPGRKSVRP